MFANEGSLKNKRCSIYFQTLLHLFTNATPFLILLSLYLQMESRQYMKNRIFATIATIVLTICTVKAQISDMAFTRMV